MKKQHLFIILAVVLLGFVFGVVQYYQALKTEDVSAITVGIPNPGHSLAQLECSADSLCVDTTNNRVGIGTANPEAKLVLSQNITANAELLRLHNPNGGYGTRIDFYGNIAAPVGRISNVWDGVNSWDMRMGSKYTANGETLVLKSSGNVGVGTTSPIAKLDVAGDIVGNAQVFRAYMSSNFSKAATWEKLPFNSVLFNTLQGIFDSSNYRFTASRAGYYQISITGWSQTGSSNNDRYGIAVYKNGIMETIAGSNYSSVDTPLSGPTINVYLNGSTDYVEIWMYSAIASLLGGGSGYGMLWSMSYLGR